MNNKIIVPKLRFPKFKNKWEKIKFIDVVDKNKRWSFTGGPFGSDLQSSDYTNKGIRIIQLQNIGDGFFDNSCKIYTTEEKAEQLKSCNIYSGDILLSKMGDPVGRSCIVPAYENRYVMCSDGIRIVVDEQIYNKYYIYYLINTRFIRNNIEKIATGSTRKRVGLEHLKNINLIITKNTEEQQKIAECLNSIDELIADEEEKLIELKNHKKGLLQKLFPKNNSSNPELRFPEFKEDWQSIKLKDISIYQNGTSYENQIDDKGNFHLITLNSLDIEGNLKQEHKKIKTPEWVLNKDDLVMVLSDVAHGNFLGLTDIIPENDKYVLNQRMALLRIKKDYNVKFIRYYINHNQQYFKSVGQGSSQKNLAKDAILNFDILNPSKKEQDKISECLSSISDMISAQTEKIEALKLHKKGLMQGLFPSLEEVKDEQ